MAGKRRISGFGMLVASVFAGVGSVVGLGYYLWPEPAAPVTEAAATPPAGPAEQQSAHLYSEEDGVSYALWEGHVIEEFDNRVIGESFKTGFDQNIYNFDLGLILHMSQEDRPTMVRTLFSELASRDHVERVRGIGCKIAREFIKRAETENAGAAPADARAFNQRHCQQAQTRPAAP